MNRDRSCGGLKRSYNTPWSAIISVLILVVVLMILCFCRPVVVEKVEDVSVSAALDSSLPSIDHPRSQLSDPAASSTSKSCRSNETHIAWSCQCHFDEGQAPSSIITTTTSAGALLTESTLQLPQVLRQQKQRQLEEEFEAPSSEVDAVSSSCCDLNCHYQTRVEAQIDAYNYLRQHVMEFDVPNLETLGFHSDSDKDNNEPPPDGLGSGLVGPTVQYAIQAKIDFAYTDALPKQIWQQYVLNYANVNEGRSNWRPYLYNKLKPLLTTNITTSSDDQNPYHALTETVATLNVHMWDILAPKGVDKIVFVGSQTPLIFDPMSVLTYGYASCTGLALLFVCALRSVGIPARVVGTPGWNQQRSHGNHNWLEVYRNQTWVFLEPTALLNPDWIDHLDQPPCRRWFCDSTRFSLNDSTTTQVFAATLERPSTTSTNFYRMAWEWESTAVPGEDVTAYYQRICSQC